MKLLSTVLTAALALTLLAGSAAAQGEFDEKELAKVRAELTATQKDLTETRQALESEKVQHGKTIAKLDTAIKKAASNPAQISAQAKLAETIRTAETLRKKLEADNAQLITAAAELDLVTKAAARTKAELVVAQRILTDAKLAKSQVELATAQKALAETKQALSKNQAELAEAAKVREILAKEVAAEKAQSLAAAVALELATKEAAFAKAELVATQKTLADAKQAKTQKDLATNQKTLAETRTAADELRKSLEAEIKNSVARLEEAKAAAAKLVLTNKDAAQTKAELNAARKTLALQPHLPVTVVVTLPADAQLTFDDRSTISIGGHREFQSPPLEVGSTFYYTLKAQVMREGKVVTMEKKIEFPRRRTDRSKSDIAGHRDHWPTVAPPSEFSASCRENCPNNAGETQSYYSREANPRALVTRPPVLFGQDHCKMPISPYFSRSKAWVLCGLSDWSFWPSASSC